MTATNAYPASPIRPPDGADATPTPPTTNVELQRVFQTACYVMTSTTGLERGDRAFATRIMLQTFMRQEMPSAAEVAAIDEICDRVLSGRTSRLADFVRAERAVRVERDGGGRA